MNDIQFKELIDVLKSINTKLDSLISEQAKVSQGNFIISALISIESIQVVFCKKLDDYKFPAE